MAKNKKTSKEYSINTSQKLLEAPREDLRLRFKVTPKEDTKEPVQTLYKVLVAKCSDSYLGGIIRDKLVEDGVKYVTIENMNGETLILAGTFYNKQKAINMISKLESLGYKPKIL